jgi:hypothetical protein
MQTVDGRCGNWSETMFGFYVSVCSVCNTGLDGDRIPKEHTSKECAEIMRIRKTMSIPQDRRMDQIEMQAVMRYEKEYGKLPPYEPEKADSLR